MNSLCIFFTLFFASISAQAIPFESKKMAFAGPNPNAIVIAEKIARQGGNVADVAVAMGFALSVTSPYFASLGGGGFAMIHFNGKTKALDFRETAPSATHPEFYLQGRSSTQGGAAVGTPGVVAGLWEIHQKYGRLPWKKLVAESIQLADNGFIVSGDWWKRTKRVQKKFSPETYQHIFKKGQYFYGLLIGFMVVLVRVINPAFPEGMMLAILFANVFAPLIDYFVVEANIKRRELRNVVQG